MADVFISYRRAHRQKVEALQERLSKLGVTCWFDRSIETGDQYRKEIKAQLAAARSVIVCWTVDCFADDDSGWVRWEAEEARNNKKLVPVKLETVATEPPFNLDQIEDLQTWFALVEHERAAFQAWQRTLERLGKLLGRPGLADLETALAKGDPNSMRTWSDRYPADPSARRFAVQERQQDGAGQPRQLKSSNVETVLPRLVHRFPYERNRMVFFTAEKTTRTAPAPVQSIVFSGDGERILLTGGDGVIRHHWCATGAQIFAHEHSLPPQTFQVTDFGGDMMPQSVKFLTSRVSFLNDDKMVGYVVRPNATWGTEWGVLDAFTGECVLKGEQGETPVFSEVGNQILVYRHDTFAISLVRLEGSSFVRRSLPSPMPTYEGSFAIGRLFFSGGAPRLGYRVGFNHSVLVDPAANASIIEFPNECGDLFDDEFPSDTPIIVSPRTGQVYSAADGRLLLDGVELPDLRRMRLVRSDGAVAALVGQNGFALIDVATGATIRTTIVPSDLGVVSRWTVVPDFLAAAAVAEHGMAGILNLGVEQSPYSLPDHGSECSAIGLSPQLDRVAVGREGGSSTIYRLHWE
ncbi:MAG: toll/interleukin-1 receptor domain-containing protein [Hyphomonadaceae bacterium]|nr:toll/interleukin-1 receptor domain-containing protein [Hyphomonadaceae bacterium]